METDLIYKGRVNPNLEMHPCRTCRLYRNCPVLAALLKDEDAMEDYRNSDYAQGQSLKQFLRDFIERSLLSRDPQKGPVFRNCIFHEEPTNEPPIA